MRYTCKRCGTSILTIDEILKSPAKCSNCGSMLEVADQIRMAPVQKPKCFSMSMEQSELVLIKRWYEPLMAFILLFLSLPCFAMVVILITKCGSPAKTFLIVFIIIFILTFCWLAFFMIWLALVCILNNTEVRITANCLSVRTYPLPYPGCTIVPSTVSTDGIDDLFCEEQKLSGRYTTYFRYSVIVLYQNGKRLNFVSQLEQPDQALFIVEKIKQYLHLIPQPSHEDSTRNQMEMSAYE